jgi:hypothetical protein
MSSMIPAETLLARITGRVQPKPHPSLLLSVLATLLPYSTSTSLSTRHRVDAIVPILYAQARKHSLSALADGRILDCVVGDALRANFLYGQGQNLEGWAEASRGNALAQATGLDKLGTSNARVLHKLQALSTPVNEEEMEQRNGIL